jgi:hypothetical protein
MAGGVGHLSRRVRPCRSIETLLIWSDIMFLKFRSKRGVLGSANPKNRLYADLSNRFGLKDKLLRNFLGFAMSFII